MTNVLWTHWHVAAESWGRTMLGDQLIEGKEVKKDLPISPPPYTFKKGHVYNKISVRLTSSFSFHTSYVFIKHLSMNIFTVSLELNKRSSSHTCWLTSLHSPTHWLTNIHDETCVCIKHTALNTQVWWLPSPVDFWEVNWRFELTALPFLLLWKDKDQIKIWVSTASHAGFLKVMRHNWLSGRADVCGGQGTGHGRGESDGFTEQQWEFLSSGLT